MPLRLGSIGKYLSMNGIHHFKMNIHNLQCKHTMFLLYHIGLNSYSEQSYMLIQITKSSIYEDGIALFASFSVGPYCAQRAWCGAVHKLVQLRDPWLGCLFILCAQVHPG